MNGSRPQTVAAALSDSPVGQLAYNELFENFGNGTSLVSPEQILTQVSLVLAHQHLGHRGALPLRGGARRRRAAGQPRPDRASRCSPTTSRRSGRSPSATTTNIVHWTEFDRGGHYAALEVPELVVGDLRVFFAQTGQTR